MNNLVHVTEVLSIIDQGFGRAEWARVERKKAIGSAFHAQSLGWVKGLFIPEVREKEIAGVARVLTDCFKRWFDLAVLEVLCVEKEFVLRELGLVGRPDIVLKLKKDRFWRVIDLKSVLTVSWVTALQLAAYQKMVQREYKIKRFEAKAALQFKENSDLPFLREFAGMNDWAVFMNCYSLLNQKRREK